MWITLAIHLNTDCKMQPGLPCHSVEWGPSKDRLGMNGWRSSPGGEEDHKVQETGDLQGLAGQTGTRPLFPSSGCMCDSCWEVTVEGPGHVHSPTPAHSVLAFSFKAGDLASWPSVICLALSMQVKRKMQAVNETVLS